MLIHKWLIILCLLFCYTGMSAESFVYLQNNSSLSFTVNSAQTGSHAMDSGEWWGMSGGGIQPWQLSTNVLWANRNEGIHNGTDFYLTTTLSSGGENIHLKMRLNGNFVGSDMWQSLEGSGFSHGWYTDRNFHSETFTINGKTITIKYTAYTAGTYDDILFVIQEHDPFPLVAGDLANPDIINVLAYNIYMLTPPISFSNQSTRAAYIHEHVQDYDVLIFNEAFDNAARNILTGNISAEYPYYTNVVDGSGSFEDGGVIIYSRWPIEYSEDIVYADCDADDCLAAKGAMYARINKLGNKYHVFGTHTQAWPDAANVATRQAQMTQLRNFVDSKNIPSTEAVILGGDFNVEKIANYLNEYDAMFTILNTEEPVYQGRPYTYDYQVSDYADAPYQEYLDYIMYEKAHLVPIAQTNKVVVLRSIANDMWDIFDLSDHLAVQGRFEFPVSLPYELAEFKGAVTEGGNILSWITASETDTDYFELEHSADGRDFRMVGRTMAMGNSTEMADYGILHSDPPAGINYYRLHQVDVDGSENYSDYLALNNKSAGQSRIHIFPNPVGGILNIQFGHGENRLGTIYNIQGKEMGTFSLNGMGSLDISGFPTGIYYLKVVDYPTMRINKL